jgi:hypothetical protein
MLMVKKKNHIFQITSVRKKIMSAMGLVMILSFTSAPTAFAGSFSPETASGSVGLQGSVSSAAPTQGATITTPVNGTNFTTLPITINGLCPKGLLVKVFSNNVFIGSVECATGSYSLQAALFSGQNSLVARVYDSLDQAGPDSNSVNVTFTDATFIQFGTQVSLTSVYATRGAFPNTELDWPIILSGGTGPYALSVDWGDGTSPQLLSESFAGNITISHTYTSSGTFRVLIKGTDKNGGVAFLQLVAVSDGAVQSSASSSGKSGTSGTGTTGQTVKILWWPAVAMLPLILATFWIGRRHELYTLRKQLEKSRSETSKT